MPRLSPAHASGAACVARVQSARYTRPVMSRTHSSWLVLLTLAATSLAGPAAAAPKAAPPPPPAPAAPLPDAPADPAVDAAQAARAAADAADAAGDRALPGAPDDEREAATAVERARQGVVLLERQGRVLGLGTVLSGDGRIISALSPLGHGNDLDARFADGSVTRVKVGHSDRAWDLALLVPQNARWKKGLKASRGSTDRAGSQLRAFSVVGARQLAPSRVIVKGQRTLVGGDSELLRDAIEFASRFKGTDLGSPIIDDKGEVAALLAMACAPVKDAPCARVPYGVPVSAVRAFLRTVPPNAVPPAPWLGIQGASDDAGSVKGVRVVSVHPKSPAAAAGLRGGADAAHADLVVAVDGVPVTTPEALAENIDRRAIGDGVELLLFGSGKFRQVSLTLQGAPDAARGARAPKAASEQKKPRKPRPVAPSAPRRDPGY